MDDRPFFSFSMDAIKPTDLRTLEKFSKSSFSIEHIIQEAGNLKIQSLLRKEIEKEFTDPSEEFVKLFAGRVHQGRITSAIKDDLSKLLVTTISSLIRDLVNDRLSTALNAANPATPELTKEETAEDESGILTTQEETAGFLIVQAIASKLVNPKRIMMRDSKSYCAILLDDNNRKSVVRLHFNGLTTKYIGTFVGKDEEKNAITEMTDIFQLSSKIEARLLELDGAPVEQLQAIAQT